MTPGYPSFSGPLSEAQDLATSIRSMSLEALPVLHGLFKASVSSIDLGDVTLEVVRSDPLLLLGENAKDRSGFLLTLDTVGETKWNGASVGASQVALFGEGCPVAIASHDALNCAIVSFTDLEIARLVLPHPRQRDPIMHVDRVAHAQLAAFAHAAEQITLPAKDIPGNAEAFRAHCMSFRDDVQNLFALPQRNAPQRRCRPPSRVRIVRSADDYLQANPARPIYTDELCTALGVSASCLHGAFEATFGLSPHRYLKLRRMAMVRTMLLTGSAPWHSVKAAALSHGFWHLGQFAHDYRALYGESPSETLIRSQ